MWILLNCAEAWVCYTILMEKPPAKIFLLIAGVAALVALALFFGTGARRGGEVQPPPAVSPEKDAVTETERLLATDPADPSHINNLKYIQAGLEKYFNDNRTYPADLRTLVPRYLRALPAYSSQQGYLYAYAPEAKPTAYHLGALLGGRNQADPQAFATDADFNSEKAGYIGGFNGTDPVYDLVGETGKK